MLRAMTTTDHHGFDFWCTPSLCLKAWGTPTIETTFVQHGLVAVVEQLPVIQATTTSCKRALFGVPPRQLRPTTNGGGQGLHPCHLADLDARLSGRGTRIYCSQLARVYALASLTTCPCGHLTSEKNGATSAESPPQDGALATFAEYTFLDGVAFASSVRVYSTIPTQD